MINQEEDPMRKLSAYELVTVDGLFSGPNGELDWAKNEDQAKDQEMREFTAEAIKASDMLLFGRETYEMMSAYWPSAEAQKNEPYPLIEFMNHVPKTVFSTKLTNPGWNNVTLQREIKTEEIQKLKEQRGRGITVLGSGSLVRALSDLALIDEYLLMIVPVILGEGKPLFKKAAFRKLVLASTRMFKNGNVLHTYRRA